jgi:hypothetical protein
MKNVYKEVNKIESDVLSFDSIVSISEAKKNLGNRLIMGNVSTYTIEFGEMQKNCRYDKKNACLMVLISFRQHVDLV